MAAEIHRLRVAHDGQFTAVEHAVLANWFGQQTPAAAAHIKLDDALADSDDCGHLFRLKADGDSSAAAVAHVLLEAIDDRLPAWACWERDDLIQTRRYREPHQKPRRRAALLPSELFAIDWALSAPGFSWPVHYHLIWTPIYDRFVVTASADCPDAFGYADFALGHFARNDNVGRSVIEIIKRDWTMQRDECSQERWEALIGTGLVKEKAVRLLADQVWSENDSDDDDGDLIERLDERPHRIEIRQRHRHQYNRRSTRGGNPT